MDFLKPIEIMPWQIQITKSENGFIITYYEEALGGSDTEPQQFFKRQYVIEETSECESCDAELLRRIVFFLVNHFGLEKIDYANLFSDQE